MIEFLMLPNGDMGKRGFFKSRIDGKEAGLVGLYIDGKPYSPDLEQARECVPLNYRKAFDRAQMWREAGQETGQPFHMTLRNARGGLIGTLYFQPLTHEFREFARESCALIFWEFLRGNIQFPEAARQMRAQGAQVEESEIRAARMSGSKCKIEILGKEFFLPQPF